ncbi:MAG TPA: cyclic nucleotide-binding domain-containing protein [Candidatus Rifleibacterium sp.]|nr:cyclic nucleotide-binding domain-containing protein [Candidatus Rifleibacterium sp.]
MKQFELDSELIPLALKTLGISDMFVCLDEKQLDELVGLAAAIHVYDEGELVITAGSASDFFLVILKGEVSVTIGEHENFIEIARLGLGHVVGEIAMLRDEAHS